MKAELRAAPRRARRTRRPRRSRRGLTLIELMVVVTILGMIAGIVGVGVYGQYVESQIKAAQTQMHNLSKAVDLYQIKFHHLPTTAEGLAALSKPPQGPALMEEVPKDPWGKDYAYLSPGRDGRKYSLKSAGPDQLMDTDDDIGL